MDQGVTLTTVGFGMGNYNDVLMEQLANDGDGAYYYVDTLAEARRIFVENLTGHSSDHRERCKDTGGVQPRGGPELPVIGLREPAGGGPGLPER